MFFLENEWYFMFGNSPGIACCDFFSADAVLLRFFLNTTKSCYSFYLFLTSQVNMKITTTDKH